MSVNIKLEKHKKQYSQINNLYLNQRYTIENACKKVGICKQTYYTIKKKLNYQKAGMPINNKKSSCDIKMAKD